MISIVLRDIPEELYTNWMAYAHQTGLPLEYLIREATTYSVRIDRLGVLDTQITKEKKLHKLKNKPIPTNNTTKQIENTSVHTSSIFEDVLSTIDLDDVIPRNI